MIETQLGKPLAVEPAYAIYTQAVGLGYSNFRAIGPSSGPSPCVF